MSDPRDDLAAIIGQWISDIPSQPDFLDAADAIIRAGWTRYPPDGNNPAALIHALVDHAGGEVAIPESLLVLAEGALTIYHDHGTRSWVIQTEQAGR